MNSKKLISITALILTAALMLTGCGGGGGDAPSNTSPAANPSTPSTPATPADPGASPGKVEMLTNNTDKPTVDIGVFEGTAEGPALITTVGQSADASMLNALMAKLENGPEYSFNALATAEDIADIKTVLICSGASTKGLGAAGISPEDEKTRATALLEALDASEATIVVCHLGGTARRGELSDEFSDMCLPYADYIIVMEEGNDDGKFSNYAEANGIPITLVNSIKEAQIPLERLFGA